MLFQKNERSEDVLEILSQCKAVVERQTQERIHELKKENENLNLFTHEDYLDSFERNLLHVKSRITGKPDSFIIASCLFVSILLLPIVSFKSERQYIFGATANYNLINNINKLNVDIALASAFEIISEPKTYYLDNNSNEWIEETHPKVEIHIPEGIIKNSPLSERFIVTTKADTYLSGSSSIMQISNFFHLVYLYCQ